MTTEQKFEFYISEAFTLTSRAMDQDPEYAPARALAAISYTLIAIAKELHEFNDRLSETKIEEEQK